jgi:hypothetical protein
MGKKKAKSKDIYERLHVFVATPAYDGKVDSDYSQSLAQAAQAATVFGINFTACVMSNGAFIDLARNIFCKFFLEDNKDCTHLLFIDSDLKFESRAFVEVIRHCTEDRPVVAGMYRRRQEPEDYPCRWTPHPELSKDGIDKLWYDEEGFLMCNRVPTGFLCIRRNIIEEMAVRALKVTIKDIGLVPRLFYTFVDEETRFIGEDFAWCDDFMDQYDKQISIWPDFDFVHGGYKCNYQKWISKNVIYDEETKGHKVPKTVGDPPKRRRIKGAA